MNQNQSGDYALTVREAADRMGMSISMMYRMLKKQTIPSFKEKGKILIIESDLILWTYREWEKVVQKERKNYELSVEMAARELKISKRRLYKAISQNELPHSSSSRGIRLDFNDVALWILKPKEKRQGE